MLKLYLAKRAFNQYNQIKLYICQSVILQVIFAILAVATLPPAEAKKKKKKGSSSSSSSGGGSSSSSSSGR